MKKFLFYILLLSLTINFNGNAQNKTGYPFIGKKYFVNNDDKEDLVTVTITPTGKLQIARNKSDIFSGDFKPIVKDSYGQYSIETERFCYMDPFNNGKVIIFYPDEAKNAKVKEQKQISNKALKTYNGPYTFDEFIGQANYSYQNNNEDERVFNGAFVFNGNVANKLYLKSQGSFKDDYKNGLWIYTSTLKSGLVTTLVQTLTANYNLGMLNGLVKVSANTSINTPNKKYSILISGTVGVQNNNFRGVMNYKRTVNGRNNLLRPLAVTGQFNDAGFCDGAWTMSYQDAYGTKMYEAKFTFINGVLINYKNIDQQTGEISDNLDRSELIPFANQLTGNKTVASVNGVERKWKTGFTKDSRLLEVQNLFCDPSLHNNPKGIIGELPKLKTKVPDLD